MVILPLTILSAPVVAWAGAASVWAWRGFRLPLAWRDWLGLLAFVASTFSLNCFTSLFTVFRLPIFSADAAACFLPLRDYLAGLGSTAFVACC